MTKKNLVFLLAIVIVAGVIYVVKSKSNQKNRVILKEVIELHQGTEATIGKIIAIQTDLKKRIFFLREEVKALKEANMANKADQLSAKTAEIEDLELELGSLGTLETEFNSLKDEVGNTLKSQKDKISKEMHDKLAVAKAKFAQLNDRFGKSIEKAGKAMQQDPSQEEETK